MKVPVDFGKLIFRTRENMIIRSGHITFAAKLRAVRRLSARTVECVRKS